MLEFEDASVRESGSNLIARGVVGSKPREGGVPGVLFRDEMVRTDAPSMVGQDSLDSVRLKSFKEAGALQKSAMEGFFREDERISCVGRESEEPGLCAGGTACCEVLRRLWSILVLWIDSFLWFEAGLDGVPVYDEAKFVMWGGGVFTTP